MAISRTSSSLELFVPIDRGDARPLHQQLEQQLREAVRSGRMTPDSRLPSTRALAAQLGVARGVVVEAYAQLVAEGYLLTRPGGTTRVARVPTGPTSHVAAPRPEAVEFDFRPGRPDMTEFPRQEWSRSLRRVLTEAPADRLGYLDGHGVPELREALSAYLDRVRGTCTRARDIVICNGYAQGLQLVAHALHETGARRVGVEDPWNDTYRRMLARSGLEIVPIPVDDGGLRVEHLEQAGVDAVVLTPAHQYPTGAVLAPERRAALIDWADRHGSMILEDDYDAEFRYDREPIGAMQGLCSERVIYAGTASKTLAPGLRLGWLAAPRRLAEGIAQVKTLADHGSSAIDQLALADFIERGELDRHLRRARAVYRERRDTLLAGLATLLPELRPTGASAGLHVLTFLPVGVDEEALVAEAAGRDISLQGLSSGYAARPARGGLVFGYAAVDKRRIPAGLERLAALDAWRQTSPPSPPRRSRRAPGRAPAVSVVTGA